MKNHLPSQLQFSHHFCWSLHDELVHFIHYGEANGLFDVLYESKSQEEAKYVEENSETDIWEWLEKFERSDVIGEILIKSIFPGLLSDFCNFLCEALICSSKAKLTVSYALLRKPLRENLHYLEWLLADTNSLLNTFYNNKSGDLAFQSIGSPENVKSRIQKVTETLVHGEVFDAELIYDLRYNKNKHFSFDQYCNQASHLITTKKPIQTDDQNFNFIFSDHDCRVSQWEHIYRYLPFLLFYTVELCEVLMAAIMKELMPGCAEARLHRTIGFILCGQEIHKYDGDAGYSSEGLQAFELECPGCQCSLPPEEGNLKKLYDMSFFECKNCNRPLRIEDFVSSSETAG